MHFSMWIWPYARWGGFDGIGRVARRLEELEFNSITVSDHVVSASENEREGDGLGAEWPDWAVTSTFLAGVTERLRIVVCVAIPYRSPLVTAKQIATVDQVSKGRFTLAACVGWWEAEFTMLGVPHEARGAITDEYLDAMRVLWTDSKPEFHGEFVEFSDISFRPLCWQAPHVPIWVAGGTGRNPLQRLARLGDGWMPMGNDSPEVLGRAISRIRDSVSEAGRDASALEFRYTIGLGDAEPALGLLSSAIASSSGKAERGATTMSATVKGSVEEVVDTIGRYAEAGFTELAINPRGTSYNECMERIEWFASEVRPKT